MWASTTRSAGDREERATCRSNDGRTRPRGPSWTAAQLRCLLSSRAVTYEEGAPVLQALAIAQAAEEVVDVARLGEELDLPESVVRERVGALEDWGLVLAGAEEGLPPVVRRAGRQYLALRGSLDSCALGFLPQVIDDLHARRALLDAGGIVVDEFRQAILEGAGVAHARDLVPDAFGPAITERIAVDLFAASVALVTRLSGDESAGCVAEEIIAVALLDEARVWLQGEVGRGRLAAGTAREAAEGLNGLFELFQDDDVLELFEMRELADAAVASQSRRNRQLGVVDQRIEAWFRPFGWTTATGYLSEPPETGEQA
jgi:hypothetical protein